MTLNYRKTKTATEAKHTFKKKQQHNLEKKKSNSDTSNSDQTDGNVGVKPASSTSPSVKDDKVTGPGKRNHRRQRRYTGNKLPGRSHLNRIKF